MTGNASTEHELKLRRRKPKHKQAQKLPEPLQPDQSQETLTKDIQSKHMNQRGVNKL